MTALKLINLLYEYDYDDVDIICVPDNIADNIEETVQSYQSWMYKNIDKHSFWRFSASGCKILSLGTDEFLWWLNGQCIKSGEKAHLISSHVKFRDELPFADF